MAGHTSEKRWRTGMNPLSTEEGVSAVGSRICEQMVAALTDARAGYLEMQEIYSFAGGTVQLLADLLFREDIAARQVPGIDAALEIDVVGGEVTGVTVVTAGSGYTDGQYPIILAASAGGGDGVAQLSYTVSGGSIVSAFVSSPGSTYTNGLGQAVVETPPAGTVTDTVANAEEVAKTQDLFDAITALNELYQCADNTVVAQEDRLAQLRRMT